MTDVEARLRQQQGEAIHIVLPKEGTLAFQKGLLAKSHLSLPFSQINRELSLSGYDWVPQGTAVGVKDLQCLAGEMESISGLIRREVLGNPSFEQRFRLPHVVYYSGFLFLVILWGGSLQRRVMKPHLKQLIRCLVAVSVLWIIQRLSKMVIPGSLDIWVRYGWYSYYVFFGLLVTFAAFLGYEADAGLQDRKWPCFLYGIGAYNMGLALMVLTNDFHHWVFTFPAGLAAADSIHEYGVGYILLQSSYALQFILVNGWLYYRIWKQKIRGMKQLIPLFISGLYVFYVVSYVCGISWASYTELVILTIAWAFLWLESLLDTGIIPSNRGYEDFFRYSHLAMEIRGKEGQVLFQSHQVPKESSEDIEKRVCPISGGEVVWYQSVKDLNEKKRKLQLMVDALERSYKLGRMEEEIRRSYIRLLTEKKAVRELEAVLESKGSLIMHYIEFLKTAKPGNEADAALSRLNVLASYIKKRCVMMMKGREEQRLWVRELKSSIEELFKYLQKTGLKCLLEFDLAGSMETCEALVLYDFIEQTAEAAMAGGETHMICSIRQKDAAYHGHILLDHHIWILPFMRQLREDSRLQIPGVRLQLRDLDYAYSVEIEVRHREDKSYGFLESRNGSR